MAGCQKDWWKSNDAGQWLPAISQCFVRQMMQTSLDFEPIPSRFAKLIKLNSKFVTIHTESIPKNFLHFVPNFES